MSLLTAINGLVTSSVGSRRASRFLTRQFLVLVFYAATSLGATPSSLAQNSVTLNPVVGSALSPITSELDSLINSLTAELAANPPRTLSVPDALDLLAATNAVIVAPFIMRRNDALLSLDLGLDRQIDIVSLSEEQSDVWSSPAGLGGPLQYAQPAGLGASSRAAAARPSLDVWTEGSFSSFEDGQGGLDSDGHAGVIYVGADYLVASGLLLGALVQLDGAEEKQNSVGSRMTGAGWMVGPYAAVRLSNHLFIQARAGWGRSDNEIDVAGAYDDHFDSDRWLVRGTLLGQWQTGQWQLRPHITVGYIEEREEAYVSSLGVLTPNQTLSLGQAKFGPEIDYRFRTSDGTIIEPNLMIEGIWNFEQSNGSLFVDDFVLDDPLRARVELGLRVVEPNRLAFGGSCIYDGIGGDYHAIGGKLQLKMPID